MPDQDIQNIGAIRIIAFFWRCVINPIVKNLSKKLNGKFKMNALKSLLFLALSIFIVNTNGVYAQTDGVNYARQFKGGKFDGLGTYTKADGVAYKGQVKDGKRIELAVIKIYNRENGGLKIWVSSNLSY